MIFTIKKELPGKQLRSLFVEDKERNCSWMVCLYPYGISGVDTNHIIIGLEMVMGKSCYLKNGVSFTFMGLNRQCDKTLTTEEEYFLTPSKKNILLRIMDIPADALFEHFCQNDTFFVKVNFFHKFQRAAFCSILNWSDNMKNMSLENPDFEIHVEDEIIKVRKDFLAAHSKVFAAMFSSDMQEAQEGKLVIHDFSAETIKLMIRYMTDASIFYEVTKNKDLFAVAHKYQVDNLLLFLEKNIINTLSEENVLEMLQWGVLYSHPMIEENALDFIASKFNKMILIENLAGILGVELMNKLFKCLGNYP